MRGRNRKRLLKHALRMYAARICVCVCVSENVSMCVCVCVCVCVAERDTVR